MSRLTTAVTLDQIDDWMSLGRRPKVITHPRSTVGGRNIDAETGKAAVVPHDPFIPNYKRHARANNPNQTTYATHYQNAEAAALTGSAYQDPSMPELESLNIETASTATGGLENLDTDTILTGTTGTVQLPDGMTESQAVEVYNHYQFRHNYDENLAITKYREEIVDTIESNQVTVLQGETGSGKTTQVPQYILDHYAGINKYCNILVTQPRRIAAISIARRVCSERGWQLGRICGYQVGLDRTASEDTRLLYCTTGVLQEKLISAKDMQQFTHVILDEVHEREQDSDFCLLIVRKLLRSNSRDTKVIMMSATIESSKFAKYFSVPVRGYLEPAPVMTVQGRTYSVSEYYLDSLRELGPMPAIDPAQPELPQETIEMAKKLIMHFDILEIQRYGEDSDGLSKKRGSVLAFLPGLGEINDLDDKLREVSTTYKLWLLPLHSTITGEEQARVFDRAPPGFRKIILSTNIAESSITVPDIVYVVDFCLTKELVCESETNYPQLQLLWASKANCTQRKGRAGRVANGRVYRMVTRDLYDNHMQDYGTPEMQRCPLEKLILKVKILDLGEPKAILGLALSPPNLDDIERTILFCKEVGALRSELGGECNPHDGQLTFLGRVLAQLPLDLRMGKLIMLGHVFGLLEECLVISSCLTNKSFFSRPYKSYLDAYRKKLEWANDSYSDCLACLNAYRTWRHMKETGRFASARDEVQWSVHSFIQLRRIREVQVQVDELRHRLQRFNIVTPRGPAIKPVDANDPEIQLILKVVLCGAFYPNYFTQLPQEEESIMRELAGHNPFTTVMVKGLPANQGVLYREPLEELFVRCDPRRQKPRAHFEETRAYVEFAADPTDRTKTNKVLSAVYLAIKMKLLRLPLELNELDPERTKQKLHQYTQAQFSLSASNKTLRSNRFVPESDNGGDEDGSDVIPAQRQVDLPSPQESVIPVVITMVVTCGHFWCYYGHDETWNTLGKVQNALNDRFQAPLQPLSPQERRVGGLCVAPYTDRTRDFYRGRIERLETRTQTAHVFFLDYGNVEKVAFHELKELDAELRIVPQQSVECELSGMKPSAIKCPNGEWTKEATHCFDKIVKGASNHYAKVYSVVHGVLRVELVVKNEHGKEMNVNQQLIDKCFADKAEESLASKQNHREREEQQDYGTVTSPRGGGGAAPRPTLGSGGPGRALAEALGARKNRGAKIRLLGPWSPYEVSFYSMCAIGRQRSSKVENDSVNCVCINAEPQDQTGRMMVAAMVGLNQSGNTLLARDSTLMPNIRGLPALMALLFAPTAELRTDRARRRVIGALCGLGWDPDSGGPALPDHDMEIQFDAEFDMEDMKMINSVRIAINLAIGSEETQAEWGQDAVLRIQKDVRQKLLKMFRKRREPLVGTNPFHKPYCWNQVDPGDLLQPNIQGGDLLNLHCFVCLEQDEEEDEEEEEEEDGEGEGSDGEDGSRATPQGATSRDSRASHAAELREHIMWLHRQANRSTRTTQIDCLLCGVVLGSPRDLLAHLSTGPHRQQEAAVFTALAPQ